MFKKIACVFLMASFIVIPAAASLYAETTIITCPKVFTSNPFQLVRIENGDGWEKSEASGYKMYCRHYVNPQGYLTCFYGPAAHGASDVMTLKRLPPDGAACKALEVASAECSFECTTQTKAPSAEKPIRLPRTIPPRR
ncbi:MAG TPA: hypothetical protein PLX02_09080 [Syntrophorhabdaceae bacterium]|nr:hypothetical protein [Syntrophorhabdaceae bacterium]HQM81760.1 hypothetical protein [Syntrophorhabdaceae bacterium]